MREILFRGKIINNGEWVEGYFYRTQKGEYEISRYLRCFDCERYTCNVDPETVGQYTGLIDKNGTKIFEGDIVLRKKYRDEFVGKIVFNQKTASFEFWWNAKVGAYGEIPTHTETLSMYDDIEVIGNVHDNPELLKESD